MPQDGAFSRRGKSTSTHLTLWYAFAKGSVTAFFGWAVRRFRIEVRRHLSPTPVPIGNRSHPKAFRWRTPGFDVEKSEFKLGYDRCGRVL